MESPQPTTRTNRYKFGNIVTFLKVHWSDYLILVILGSIIIVLDQWTKALVRANVPAGTDWLPAGLAWLAPYARIRHWYNSGAAFGIFQNGNLVFTILAIIVIILIFIYFPRTQRNDWWLRVAMSMQFAGAAGNLIDRLYFKQVTDFISVGNFAIFNIADASISTGVAVLLVGVWLKDREEKKRAALPILSGEELKGVGENVVDAPGEEEGKGG
jgi:signal peptidase II